jgi:hypothetical protein
MKKYFKANYGARFPLSCLIFLIALGTMSTGCATRTAMQTQLDLGSCGFHWQAAETPGQMKHLESLPQRQMVRHKNDSKYFYVYADAKECKCIYFGNEKAYQQYIQLLRERHTETKKDIAIDEMNLTDRDSELSKGWAAWGDLLVQ